MRRSDSSASFLPALLVALALALSLLAGVEREVSRRWPLEDHPRVDQVRIRLLTEQGRLSPREGAFWKPTDAGTPPPQDR